MIASNKVLCFNVTNKNYYVRVNVNIDSDEEFHAAVNANMFLKLISQITTESVELKVNDKALNVVGNGSFNIPLILAFDKIVELPELTIDNITKDFTVSRDILMGILNYNTKEIMSNNVFQDIVRKSYYIDEKGCITFTTGACVNNFSLPAQFKIVLSNQIVKLFKLFNDDEVRFEIGFSQVGSDLQVRIRLSDSSITVSAATYSSDALTSKFPIDAIRNMASKVYPYSISVNRNELAQAINRFSIFSNFDTNTTECSFTFVDNNIVIENSTGDTESIRIDTPVSEPYKAVLDLISLKNAIDSSKDSNLSINFGDHTAFVFVKGDISNILPECVSSNE